MKKIWYAIWKEYRPFLQYTIAVKSIELQEKGYSKDTAYKRAEKQVKIIFNLLFIILFPLSLILTNEMIKFFLAFN